MDWHSHSQRLQSEGPSQAGSGPTTTAFNGKPTTSTEVSQVAPGIQRPVVGKAGLFDNV